MDADSAANNIPVVRRYFILATVVLGSIALFDGAAYDVDDPAADAGRHVGDPGRDRLGHDLQHPGHRRRDADDRLAGRPVRQQERDGAGGSSLFSLSTLLCGIASRSRCWCCGASSRAAPARRSCRCRRRSCSTRFPRRQHGMMLSIFGMAVVVGAGDRPRARRLSRQKPTAGAGPFHMLVPVGLAAFVGLRLALLPDRDAAADAARLDRVPGAGDRHGRACSWCCRAASRLDWFELPEISSSASSPRSPSTFSWRTASPPTRRSSTCAC